MLTHLVPSFYELPQTQRKDALFAAPVCPTLSRFVIIEDFKVPYLLQYGALSIASSIVLFSGSKATSLTRKNAQEDRANLLKTDTSFALK